MSAEIKSNNDRLRTPWNKGRLVGQKRPLRPKEVWAIRVRLQMKNTSAIWRSISPSIASCADAISLAFGSTTSRGGRVRRATIIQHKTSRPVQFEIMEQTRASLQEWLNARPADRGPYVFPSRVHDQPT